VRLSLLPGVPQPRQCGCPAATKHSLVLATSRAPAPQRHSGGAAPRSPLVAQRKAAGGALSRPRERGSERWAPPGLKAQGGALREAARHRPRHRRPRRLDSWRRARSAPAIGTIEKSPMRSPARDLPGFKSDRLSLGKGRRREMAGSVYLKDCHRNMKLLPDSIYEVALLPTGIVCAPERDQDVVGFETTQQRLSRLSSVCQRRLVPSRAHPSRPTVPARPPGARRLRAWPRSMFDTSHWSAPADGT
jgi:hypothetical protein